jgi:hypothetical protein
MASAHDVLHNTMQLPEGMTLEELHRVMEEMDMSPKEDHAVRAAIEYIKVLQNEGYFATAYMVPIDLDGVRGIIVAVSSAKSTNVCKDNHETHAARALITDPHWLHYDVWWFPGLAQLNLNGISSSM